MSVTIITCTRFDRPALLERCKASVAAALPPGGQHVILECNTGDADWARTRVLAAQAHPLVAFVDDDDYIAPDAITRCVAALEATGLGAACTNDVFVDLHGNAMPRMTLPKTYQGAAAHPMVIHHLCVMRGALVDSKALELHNRYGLGVDWFIRSSVALRHGCVHVPIDGYFWTQHEDQHTQQTREQYMLRMKAMRRAIRETWPLAFRGNLPIASTPH